MTTTEFDEAPSAVSDVIVVGVNGSRTSTRALIWAMSVAVERGWTVEVVTAWPPAEAVLVHPVPGHYCEPLGLAVSAQHRALVEASSASPSVPPVTTHRVNARPVEALVERSHAARLVVIGATRRSTVHEAPVGASVGRSTACPVIVINRDGEPEIPLTLTGHPSPSSAAPPSGGGR